MAEEQDSKTTEEMIAYIADRLNLNVGDVEDVYGSDTQRLKSEFNILSSDGYINVALGVPAGGLIGTLGFMSLDIASTVPGTVASTVLLVISAAFFVAAGAGVVSARKKKHVKEHVLGHIDETKTPSPVLVSPEFA